MPFGSGNSIVAVRDHFEVSPSVTDQLVSEGNPEAVNVTK